MDALQPTLVIALLLTLLIATFMPSIAMADSSEEG
jgi:hypothetical protein